MRNHKRATEPAIFMNEPQTNARQDWPIARLLAWTAEHFTANQIDSPRLAAELLLAKVLDCKRIDLYTRFDESPSETNRAKFRDLVRRAAAHEPIAHLVGHKEFYSLDFQVGPDVLVPRPETELLVELALRWCDENTQPRYDLLDIGAGSGCIVITIAKRQPAIKAVATDLSRAALKIARQNADAHNVDDRIRFIEADMLDLPNDAVPEGGFDLIVANPPYIAEHERDTLPDNVRKYEPPQALFAGPDGLDAYRKIGNKVQHLLKPGAMLMLEVACDQADAVEDLLTQQSSGLKAAGRFKDLNGIDRALQFTLQT